MFVVGSVHGSVQGGIMYMHAGIQAVSRRLSPSMWKESISSRDGMQCHVETQANADSCLHVCFQVVHRDYCLICTLFLRL